jgi:hypothetical protein
MKSRYHKLDNWRGYRIPGLAVAGASDTGTWSDSPCPSDKVAKEIRRLQRECLRPAGIKSRQRAGGSSNCFCGKRWVCVSQSDWPQAAPLAQKWLDDNDQSLQFLHSADQPVTDE